MLVSQDTLFYAFRYALGRASFAPKIVIDDVLKNLDLMDEHSIKQIIREIETAPSLGHDMDKIGWLVFKEKLEQVVE